LPDLVEAYTVRKLCLTLPGEFPDAAG